MASRQTNELLAYVGRLEQRLETLERGMLEMGFALARLNALHEGIEPPAVDHHEKRILQ
jgi:hypothetical protein